jgi:ribulose-phosphate 3-epimerase
MSRFLIAPSILSADFGKLAEEVSAAEAAGVDWIHCDVMDGHFVPNLTIGPAIVEAVSRATDLPRDVHLMVSNPDAFIDAFVDAGATTLGVHVEACPHLHRSLERIKTKGLRASVTLNPATPASSIENVLQMVDQVLVMTVNPGFGGQAFIPEVMPKLRQIRGLANKTGRQIDVQVDGGIALETLEEVALNGANVFVMGSAFFKRTDYAAFVQEVRARLGPYTPGDAGGSTR